MANKVILVGRLGTDAELKKGNSGSSWGRMRLATDESYTDRDGKKVEKTEWHSVITFGRLAEICAEHLGKGSLVYVEGSLQTRSWDKDGDTRYVTEIKASKVQFLDSKPLTGKAQDGQHVASQAGYYEADSAAASGYDEIPF